MAQVLVRLEKAQEKIVKSLIDNGVYKTKSEAVRAGILELGKQYEIFGSMVVRPVTDTRAIAKMERMWKEVQEGKRKVYTQEEVDKKYGFK